MRDDQEVIRARVPVSRDLFLDRLLEFISEQLGLHPRALHCAPAVGGTHFFYTETAVWYWRHDSALDPTSSSIQLALLTLDDAAVDVAAVQSTPMLSRDTKSEDSPSDTVPVLPGFRGRRVKETPALSLSMKTWETTQTEFVANWQCPEGLDWYERVASYVSSQVPSVANNLARRPPRKTGHPGLDQDELVRRLAKAQEAEELRKEIPDMTWKEIAKEIEWPFGWSASGVKLLYGARKRLERYLQHDPDGILDLVRLRRSPHDLEGKEKN